MCDFHSILGVALKNECQLIHEPSNSHSGMAGNMVNKPNRDVVIFEVECSTERLLKCDDLSKLGPSIIRNFGECPERLVNKIINHYAALKKALTTGEGLSPDGYFYDTAKYCDVWNEAIRFGVPVTLPEIFHGNLAVSGSAKLDAPQLKEVGGYLDVSGSAKLDALTKVGGYLAVYGSAKLDAPQLKEVGGNLAVSGSAKLDAPQLKSVNGKDWSAK